MPKIPKNSIIVIALSIISLILGGTFFVISQNKSGQSVANKSISVSSNSINSQSQNTVSSQKPTNSSSNSLQGEKSRIENFSKTLNKIDISQKPLLLTDTGLLDQNKQSLLPQISPYPNPKPIFVESEKTIYFPYGEGYIAKINVETGEVKWDIFDFQISQMSLFNGNYYLTEYRKGCIGDSRTAGIENVKCKIFEIERKNPQSRKVLIEVNSSDLYVAFTNPSNFWLATGFAGAGEASSIGFSKYKKSGEFVENFSLLNFLTYIQEDWTKESKYNHYCPNRIIYQEIKDKNVTFDLGFDYEEKKFWTSPYNECKTLEDQEKAHTDKTGEQIFQSKFPFYIQITRDKQKEVTCQKWQYKSMEDGQFKLLWDNQQVSDYEETLNCIQ